MSQLALPAPPVLRITNHFSGRYYLGEDQVSEPEFFAKMYLNDRLGLSLIDTKAQPPVLR